MKAFRNTYKTWCKVILLLLLPVYSFSQNVIFSDPVKEDAHNADYKIIGKMKGNILVFKNSKSNYSISIYDKGMALKDNFKFDFLPSETFNVDYIPLTDSFYLIYQYKKKGVVHCMAAKLDANAQLLRDPIELDNTKIDWLSDNKVYSAIYSDDKQRIMVFKILKKNDNYNFETFLFDNNLKLLHQSQTTLPFDDRKDLLSDFFIDNDGDFVFVKATRPGSREDIDKIGLIIKSPAEDTFEIKNINLNNNYLDEIKLKIDNANKHYIVNSFYYNNRSGNLDGIFCTTWDKQNDSALVRNFIPLDDSLRAIAKTSGSSKSAFNDFFIKSIIVKKDGGYLLAAEDYYEQTNGLLNNPWNRMNYLYGSPYGISPYYSPYSYWEYGGFNNNQSIRYYYNNVLVMSIDKNGKPEWGNMLRKNQYADNDNSYLSYLIITGGGEIHFLFNDIGRRTMLLQDNAITADGTLTRNPPLKTMENDYEFMPKFGRQVGAREVIIPCTYRNSISFAKIDY